MSAAEGKNLAAGAGSCASGCGGGGAPDAAQRDVQSMDRREFLFLTAGIAASAILQGCDPETREALLAKNFRELTPEEVEAMVARVAADCSERFGKPVRAMATPAQPGVSFGYGLDLSRCIGCRRCVYACARENNQSRDPQIHWIRVLEMEKEHGIDFTHATAAYDPATVPAEGKFYMPIGCQQCRRPPCVQSCPVGATWQEPDGIVVIDPDWCIGCRCCMAACPYGARHFNWAEPNLPAGEMNPDIHVLGNRPRRAGVVEKCTFCIQRTRNGRYPACVEICPVGARKFGNLLDPESEIRYIMDHKRVFVLKEELNTQPRFYYFYGT